MQLPPHAISSRVVAIDTSIVAPHDLWLTEQTYTIGRAPGCTIVVSDPLVSRLHARIERQNAWYVIIDEGSVNGTFVNGQRLIDKRLLRTNDEIGLGSPVGLLRFVDPESTVMAEGLLIYDDRDKSFFLGDAQLDLSPLQFRLLLHLYQNAGEVCSRTSCAQAIWDRAYDPEIDSGALDQAVNSLRRALKRARTTAHLIETRRGIGYRLRSEAVGRRHPPSGSRGR